MHITENLAVTLVNSQSSASAQLPVTLPIRPSIYDSYTLVANMVSDCELRTFYFNRCFDEYSNAKFDNLGIIKHVEARKSYRLHFYQIDK